MHGRTHEAVHKNRAGFFVYLVLDGVGVHGDFNDHIEGFRCFGAGGDVVQ